METKNKILLVKNKKIDIMTINEQEYFCLTDMCAKQKQIKNCITNSGTILFLKTWEELYNQYNRY